MLSVMCHTTLCQIRFNPTCRKRRKEKGEKLICWEREEGKLALSHLTRTRQAGLTWQGKDTLLRQGNLAWSVCSSKIHQGNKAIILESRMSAPKLGIQCQEVGSRSGAVKPRGEVWASPAPDHFSFMVCPQPCPDYILTRVQGLKGASRIFPMDELQGQLSEKTGCFTFFPLACHILVPILQSQVQRD